MLGGHSTLQNSKARVMVRVRGRLVSNLRGAPGYVYPRRTLSPCAWDCIRTHTRSIDLHMGPVRGTPSTACPKGWVGGKIFRSTNVMVVGMLCSGIELFGFQLRSENCKVACSKSVVRPCYPWNLRLREIEIPRSAYFPANLRQFTHEQPLYVIVNPSVKLVLKRFASCTRISVHLARYQPVLY